MLTADMARDMSGDQKVTEALEYFECCIQAEFARRRAERERRRAEREKRSR